MRSTWKGVWRRRSVAYGALGTVLALGAPLGLLLVRGAFSPGRVAAEIANDTATYLYVTVSTAIVFTLFGGALGRRVDRLAEQATTDPLTGLANARSLRDHLRRELSRAARYRHPVSLLLIDVDRFKTINDDFGHDAGDRALRHVGQAIRSQLRESDVGARWGGDEFALLAPSTPEHAAEALAQRVRSVVAQSPAGDDLPHLTASVGIATFDGAIDPATDPLQLTQAADRALYHAKQAGRDRYVIGRLSEG